MKQKRKGIQILAGMALLGVAHILLWLLSYLMVSVSSRSRLVGELQTVALFLFFGIGISQLLYAIPLCFWLGRKQQLGMRSGVIIGAVLTLLLNGSCFVYLVSVW